MSRQDANVPNKPPSQLQGKTGEPLRVLVGWELGNGLGHVGRLRPIVEWLAGSGHEVYVVARYPRSAACLTGSGAVRIEAAPFWSFAPQDAGPHRRCAQAPDKIDGSTPDRRRDAATLADILERGGFSDVERVAARTGEWRVILQRTDPHLVVSEYAPGLNAVARDQRPVPVLGSGFTVPPSDGLYPLSPRSTVLPNDASDPARRIVAAFASAASSVGFDEPTSFGELFGGTLAVPLVHPLLDPYRRWRKTRSLPPIGVPLPRATDGLRTDVFVYLPEGHPRLSDLLDVIEGFSLGGTAYVRPSGGRLRPDTVERVRRTPLRLLDRPADLSSTLPNIRVAIHSGGLNVAHSALYALTPQLLLPTNLEQRLTGETVRAAGAGDYAPPRRGRQSDIRGLLRSLLDRDASDAKVLPVDPGKRSLALIREAVTQLTGLPTRRVRSDS